MTDYQHIYQTDAARYDAMVSAEDVDGNLPHTLAAVLPAHGRLVDIGCGTGRVGRIALAVTGLEVLGVEPALPMLEVARVRASAEGHAARARFVEGAADALPVPDAWADAAIAGWVYGHQVGWAGDAWPVAIGKFLDEMRRVTRPGGVCVVIETLGTGLPEPGPRAPSPGLASYYAWLEAEHGFVRHAIDTSYGFASVDEAALRMGFFFGPRIVDAIRAHGWSRVPEWTGVWVTRR
ncbi:MAG: class I SAM-dependent methyltransferase [Deltaproteobacteria bacterium]|nr:class I SAM-dependent methyltransferase [Deltaproteobacteria bacterium]